MRPPALNDSALLYYFGASEAAAIRLPPGESATLSVSLSRPPPDELCDTGAADDCPGGEQPTPGAPGLPPETQPPGAEPAFPVTLPRTGGPPPITAKP